MAYTLTGEKCGTVRFDAEKTGIISAESEQGTSKVTSNPVEQGADINDHVVNDPDKYTLTGVLIGGDASMEMLRRMRREKDVLTYTGRIRIESCVIISLKYELSAKNRDGCSITLQLQALHRSTADYVASGERLMSAQDAAAEKAVPASQTRAARADGLRTVATQSISSSAYAEYVRGYASGKTSGAGPTDRSTAAYSAA